MNTEHHSRIYYPLYISKYLVSRVIYTMDYIIPPSHNMLCIIWYTVSCPFLESPRTSDPRYRPLYKSKTPVIAIMWTCHVCSRAVSFIKKKGVINLANCRDTCGF